MVSHEESNPPFQEKDKQKFSLVLIIIAVAQLMLVLDDTIANIALPSIQADLQMSAIMLPWVVNAYLLAFGSLLLLGRCLGDIYGRRKILRSGMLIFVLGSLLCGIAPNSEFLIFSRILQGVGAALTAPNALALIAVIFPEGKQRNHAMAIYGAMSALGIVGGVILGGVLTGLLTWSSVFVINVPIGIVILIYSQKLPQGEFHKTSIGGLNAISGALALFLLTYTFTRIAEYGWSDYWVVGTFIAALIFVFIFVRLQINKSALMLPLTLFKDMNRAISYITMLFVGAGLMGTFYLLALFMQKVMLFSAIQAGLAALPFGFGIVIGSIMTSKVVEKTQPKVLITLGLIISSVGIFWLSTINISTSYFLHIMQALFIVAFGLGIVAITLTLTAVYQVPEKQVSIASAVLNSSKQTGAAFGLAGFTTIAAYTSSHLVKDSHTQLVYGYSIAFFYAALLMIFAAFIVFFFFKRIPR